MSTIAQLFAFEVLDSRGNPTVKVCCALDNGIVSSAYVPSGASTGKYEALELRDGDSARFKGKGVLKAVENVNTLLSEKLKGFSVLEQRLIDTTMIELDGTENKSNLGANAILGVSLAVARAAAETLGMPLWFYIGGISSASLPIPMLNFINGGLHADSGIDIQEFMIVPVGAPTFKEAIRSASEIFHTLKELLRERGLSTGVGDEGGFAPRLKSTRAVLDIIKEAVEKAGYTPGENIFFALDSAATEFQEGDKYRFEGKMRTAGEMIDIYEDLIENYPIISLEDPLGEDDWSGWQRLTERLGKKVQVVGDDIFVTNPERLKRGISEGVANAILIKLNQIGTLTETLNVIAQAKANNYRTIISHRSGETEDTFIADLAVGTSACQIKTGSMSRSDRIAKYNRLIMIEEELGGMGSCPTPEAVYPHLGGRT